MIKNYLGEIIIGLIGLLVLFDLYIQYARYTTNWCEAEIEVMRLSIDRLVEVHGIDLSE
jgi:hypothetical protein